MVTGASHVQNPVKVVGTLFVVGTQAYASEHVKQIIMEKDVKMNAVITVFPV